MTDITEFAREFVKLLIEEDDAGCQAMWSDDIVSLEPQEGEMARVEGRDALLAKHAWWNDNSELHSVDTDGPYIFGDQFAVKFTMDVTMFGERSQSSEIGLYTVKDGKIVEERFLYGTDEDY